MLGRFGPLNSAHAAPGSIATAGTPASFEVETLVAEAPLVDLIFKDGFEPSTP